MAEAARNTPDDLADAAYRVRIGVDLLQECEHRVLPALVEPAFRKALAAGTRDLKLQTTCPDCMIELDARFWRPEAGGWYLRLQERLAAGRKWIYRYERDRWIASA